jgi:hypothetical protein
MKKKIKLLLIFGLFFVSLGGEGREGIGYRGQGAEDRV